MDEEKLEYRDYVFTVEARALGGTIEDTYLLTEDLTREEREEMPKEHQEDYLETHLRLFLLDQVTSSWG